MIRLTCTGSVLIGRRLDLHVQSTQLRGRVRLPRGEEGEIDEHLVEGADLDETFRQGQPAERLFGVLKDDDMKLEFNKRGYERVTQQVYLVLIVRLLTALAMGTKSGR